MGMNAEAVESLLEWLRSSQAADQEQVNREGLGQLHEGRAEAFQEVISMIESSRTMSPEETAQAIGKHMAPPSDPPA